MADDSRHFGSATHFAKPGAFPIPRTRDAVVVTFTLKQYLQPIGARNSKVKELVGVVYQLKDIFRNQLAMREVKPDVVDYGTVISLGDGIARVYGCEACLAVPNDEFALATSVAARHVRYS